MTYRRRAAFAPFWPRKTLISAVEPDDHDCFNVRVKVFGEKLWHGRMSADSVWYIRLTPDDKLIVVDDEPVVRVMRYTNSHPWEQMQIKGKWYDTVDQAVWLHLTGDDLSRR